MNDLAGQSYQGYVASKKKAQEIRKRAGTFCTNPDHGHQMWRDQACDESGPPVANVPIEDQPNYGTNVTFIRDGQKVPYGTVKFINILEEIKELHLRKAADYGSNEDVFANISASEAIGIPAWKGAWLRARDKVKRIDAYCLNGKLRNEGVEDSLLDLAAYSIIALIKFREWNEEESRKESLGYKAPFNLNG
jgi:hypothetical protein